MKRLISLALCFMLVFTLCPSVFAVGDTMTWTGTSSDNWNVAGNWDPAQVPGMGDTAVIPESKKAVVDDTTSVTLDCSGEVSVESGKTLWLTGTSYLKGGKLSGDGDVTIMVNDSELQWSGGSIEGNGTFTVGENTRLVIDTAYVVGITCPLENKGQVMLNAGDLCLYGGGTGAGTFTVSGGAYLYFEQGNYSIGGNFVNSGEMTIWDTSSVSFNAGYRQDSTGTLALKVWGSGSNEYCKLDVADAAELGGILEIDFINDYDPQVGDTFEIMTCGSRAGEFSEINSNMEGITLVPAYTGTGLTLTVSDGTTPEENVCEIGENKYTTLDSALSAAISGQTIKLLKSIDYDHSIEIVNKSITFDLNGFNLNILNTTVGGTIEENSGLYVKGNAAVSLEGAGEFNVTGTWYGVFAERDSESGGTPSVTVTNATGIGRDGVAAQYSKVTVKGDATSRGSTYSGVWASYENAEVIVEGDVYANGEMSMGVNTDTLALVTVKGSVAASGSGSMGIKAGDDGDVTVNGNVSASGSGSIGVRLLSEAGKKSIVTIKGVIEAEKYILFEAEDESKWEYSLRDGDLDKKTGDYIYYTKDNESFVYVSTFAGGSGTAEDPYLIAHESQLYNIKYYHFFGKHYKQIADIDLGGYFSLGEGWDPIGLGESPFLGVYDGDGHTISYLFINRPYQGDIGLFGCVGERSEIRNVGLINADVTGRHEVGGLAAINAGLIANSYVTGEVSGTTYAGGLIGYNMGSVTDSYFDGTVSHVKGFDTDEVEYAGGLVGCNSEEGSITGCYAKATVESGGPLIGGLAGGNLGSITDSHAISAVTGYYYVGGLTGSNEGIVNNSYADGNVTGTSLVGGLIGYNSSLLADSYFTGTVTASDDYTGGLVGDNSGGSIEGCHADATVTSTGDYVGGLAGRSIGLITGSWSAGAVTGGSHVGGLVGASFINAGSGVISEGISASYSACAVTGKSYIGGLVGSNETPISESYAKGNVTKADEVDFTYTHFGGLVGKNTGPVGDSYAWGNVSGHQYVGGLIGYNEADVTNCYEIGAVSGNSNTGGLIGVNSSGANIVGSFWNNNTSRQESSDGGISAGSVAMKQQATYDSNVEADWDFDTIWGIDTDENDGYPFLIWQVGAEFARGSGTPEDPYLIATADQLYNVRNHLDKHYKLIENIDMSGYSTDKGWEPIGGEYTPFTGSFDGNGYTISGLVINRPITPFIGLFANIGLDAEIRNVSLIDVNVTGYNHVGGLAGRNRGQVTNSYAIGNVTGEAETGGLVGENSGPISDSYAQGTVTDKYGGKIGGLVGENTASGTITSCYAEVEVTVTSGNTSYGSAGGLVGYNFGGITESYAVGAVLGRYNVGGLVGTSTGTIDKSYATATVTGTDSNYTKVGGLVGNNNGSISNSFARGDVSGNDQVGGLVGYNKSSYTSSNEKSSITASYATGKVNGSTSYIGGLAGYNYDKGDFAGIITDSYWDKETSLLNTSAGGTGKTTEEMKQQATYVDWNFATIWGINAGFNDGYPFLRWQGYEAVPTAPTVPQTFTATPGDGQVALSWTAPASDGGAAITRYEVSGNNGGTWVTAATNTSHTFTGLTNDTAHTFKVRAVNSVGNGAEASVSATPTAFACEIDGAGYPTLDDALAAVQSGQTIKLLKSVNHMKSIVVENKSITFDVGTFNLNVYQDSGSEGAKGLLVTGGAHVNLIGTGQFNISQTGGNFSSGVYVEQNSSAKVTNIMVTVDRGSAFGAYADGAGAVIHVMGNINVMGEGGCGAKTWGRGKITVEGFITAINYINIGNEYKAKSSGVEDTANPGYLKYSTSPIETGIVWVKAASAITYPITVQNDGNGTATADLSSATQDTEITLTATPDSGYRFKEWQIISGGVSIVNNKFIMPAENVTVKVIFELIPVTAYTVTVNGSSAAATGAGSYAQGATVTISAGSRSSYTFAGWTSPDGVTFMNANNATTTFTMPDKNVVITANWSYNGSGGGSSGGGSGGGDSSTPTTPAAPSYKADVKEGSGAETIIPVTVGKDAGTASVDAGSQGLNQRETVITIPSIPDVDTYSVGIPVPDLSTSDVQGTLTVNTDAGNITISSNMLTGVSGISGSKAEIAIGQGDKSSLPEDIRDVIGDRPLIQLSLSIDGKQADWSNPDAPVTVSIPYTPTAAELANPESIVVWYIDGSGNVVTIPNGHYDPVTGMVTFDTTHFSDYAVAYNKVSFNDVTADAWYHKAVSFIAARGVTCGTGNGNYSPEAKLTRGQFIVMLMKAYGITPDADPEYNFADAGATYYTGYLAAAKRLSISSGVGNNMFAPEKEITRQEMFTLLYNALKVIGQLPQGDSDKTLDHFSDAGQIDSWAKEAMTLLVKTGTIGGNAGKLNPTSTTTRAEMAQVLYNLLSK